MLTVYGLKTCDSCRKAVKALTAAGQDVDFVDIRETPVPDDLRLRLVETHGDAAVNKRSKTWAALPEAERALPPESLLARHPVAMKRPLIVAGDRLYLGWTGAVSSALIP